MIDRKIVKVWLTIFCFFMLIWAITAKSIRAEERQSLVFSTWEGFEPDKCASIWLIQHFINSSAVIRFFPKGETINKGIPFDTPDAKLRRYAKMSTFESLLDHYKITDPKLIYIGRIIHDMEINIWERKVMPETNAVQEAIITLITRVINMVSSKRSKVATS